MPYEKECLSFRSRASSRRESNPAGTLAEVIRYSGGVVPDGLLCLGGVRALCNLSPRIPPTLTKGRHTRERAVMADSQAKKEQRALLTALATAGGKLTAEEDIVFEGQKLVLPERYRSNLDGAIQFLVKKRDEDERSMAFNKVFRYRPWDGAHATMVAIKKAFGMMGSKSIQTFFGEQPPELRTIATSIDTTEQVPWGCVTIPLMPEVEIYLGANRDPEMGLVFVINAEGPRKYRFHMEGLFRFIEQELEEASIYRGKAFDGADNPNFLDLRGFDPKKVVYSQEVLTQLDANVWSVMRYAEKMAELGMPTKRAVLMEGPYGTGKTLAATWTARVAEECGWTFITCRPNKDDLFTTMQTAKLYQPAVVFFEDIDTVANPEGSDQDQVSQLLDVFDGIQAKDTKIIVVLTTNHVEEIHKGMLRPGRMDAVIHIGELDAAGFERLIKAVVPMGSLAADIDYAEVARAFDGFLPAFAKEAIDRTLRYNIARNEGVVTMMNTHDFVEAANGLRPQLELMHGASEKGSALTIDDLIQDAAKTGTKGLQVRRNQDNLDWGTIADPSDNGLAERH